MMWCGEEESGVRRDWWGVGCGVWGKVGLVVVVVVVVGSIGTHCTLYMDGRRPRG